VANSLFICLGNWPVIHGQIQIAIHLIARSLMNCSAGRGVRQVEASLARPETRISDRLGATVPTTAAQPTPMRLGCRLGQRQGTADRWMTVPGMGTGTGETMRCSLGAEPKGQVFTQPPTVVAFSGGGYPVAARRVQPAGPCGIIP